MGGAGAGIPCHIVCVCGRVSADVFFLDIIPVHSLRLRSFHRFLASDEAAKRNSLALI